MAFFNPLRPAALAITYTPMLENGPLSPYVDWFQRGALATETPTAVAVVVAVALTAKGRLLCGCLLPALVETIPALPQLQTTAQLPACGLSAGGARHWGLPPGVDGWRLDCCPMRYPRLLAEFRAVWCALSGPDA